MEPAMSWSSSPLGRNAPWNKDKLVGQKPPLKLKEIWEIRIRLKLANHLRDLALINLAVDSKLRGYDLVRIRVNDIAHGNSISSRAMVIQRKTQHPVQFEVTLSNARRCASSRLQVLRLDIGFRDTTSTLDKVLVPWSMMISLISSLSGDTVAFRGENYHGKFGH
jgi:hypothetical protein